MRQTGRTMRMLKAAIAKAREGGDGVDDMVIVIAHTSAFAAELLSSAIELVGVGVEHRGHNRIKLMDGGWMQFCTADVVGFDWEGLWVIGMPPARQFFMDHRAVEVRVQKVQAVIDGLYRQIGRLRELPYLE